MEVSLEPGGPFVLLLVSGIAVDVATRAQQQRSVALLQARGVAFETVDGAEPEHRATRDRLFAISGRRGAYPQFFVVGEEEGGSDGAPRFVGLWDAIERLNECDAAGATAHLERVAVRNTHPFLGSF